MVGFNIFIEVWKKGFVGRVEPVIKGEFEVKFIFCFRLNVDSDYWNLCVDFLKVGLEFNNSVAFKQVSSGVSFFVFKKVEFRWGKCDSNNFDAYSDELCWRCRKGESLVCGGWVIRVRGYFFENYRIFDFKLDNYIKDILLKKVFKSLVFCLVFQDIKSLIVVKKAAHELLLVHESESLKFFDVIRRLKICYSEVYYILEVNILASSNQKAVYSVGWGWALNN